MTAGCCMEPLNPKVTGFNYKQYPTTPTSHVEQDLRELFTSKRIG